MTVVTYTSNQENCELYTKIYGSIAINDCQIGIFKKEKILLEDNILMKYSKSSPSGTFGLDDYIQFTLPSATCSMNDFISKN